jgi:hypothetical protein
MPAPTNQEQQELSDSRYSEARINRLVNPPPSIEARTLSHGSPRQRDQLTPSKSLTVRRRSVSFQRALDLTESL